MRSLFHSYRVFAAVNVQQHDGMPDGRRHTDSGPTGLGQGDILIGEHVQFPPASAHLLQVDFERPE